MSAGVYIGLELMHFIFFSIAYGMYLMKIHIAPHSVLSHFHYKYERNDMRGNDTHDYLNPAGGALLIPGHNNDIKSNVKGVLSSIVDESASVRDRYEEEDDYGYERI